MLQPSNPVLLVHLLVLLCKLTFVFFSNALLCRFSDTAVARVSDDFYPRDPASSSPHIAACSYNSLLMGVLIQPDWDMFHRYLVSIHVSVKCTTLWGTKHIFDVHTLQCYLVLSFCKVQVLRCKVHQVFQHKLLGLLPSVMFISCWCMLYDIRWYPAHVAYICVNCVQQDTAHRCGSKHHTL